MHFKTDTCKGFDSLQCSDANDVGVSINIRWGYQCSPVWFSCYVCFLQMAIIL